MELLIFFGICFFIFYFLDRKKISKSKSKQNYEYLKEFLKSDYTYTPSTYTEYELPNLIYISQVEKKAYLDSPQWKAIKRQRLAMDQYTCQSCYQSGLSLEVHHLHYRTFKSESLSDLISVCRNCHEAIHSKYGFNYNDEFPLVKPKRIN